jgi:hypothetical protein
LRVDRLAEADALASGDSDALRRRRPSERAAPAIADRIMATTSDPPDERTEAHHGRLAEFVRDIA